MAGLPAWKCDVCGFVHQGDEPPEICPVCGVDKDLFSLLEVTTHRAKGGRGWRCTVCNYELEAARAVAPCPVCGAGPEAFEPVPDEDVPPVDDTDISRIVIVGDGVAGVTAAEQARRAAPRAEILLVGREAAAPYQRLNLTRFLAGAVGEEALPLQPEGWYPEHRIQRVQGDVDRLDLGEGAVYLEDGRVLGWDRLVLATGAHAFVPPIPGARRPGVQVLRTLEDARALLQRAAPGSRWACIGGGLLGIEAAGALARRGVAVTVLESFRWLLPRQLPEAAGRLLAAHLEARGIGVRTGVTVSELSGHGAVAAVRLADGAVLPVDGVVVAAGVRPETWLARRAGLVVRDGVVVDDRMATSHPRVFAAGDVAEHDGVLYGLWPAAWAQGAVAGRNAAGAHATFPGLAPATRLKVLDVDVSCVGMVQPPDGSWRVVETSGPGTHLRLVVRDGRLVGASLYGDVSMAPALQAAVEEGAALAERPDLLERFPGLAEAAGGWT